MHVYAVSERVARDERRPRQVIYCRRVSINCFEASNVNLRPSFFCIHLMHSKGKIEKQFFRQIWYDQQIKTTHVISSGFWVLSWRECIAQHLPAAAGLICLPFFWGCDWADSFTQPISCMEEEEVGQDKILFRQDGEQSAYRKKQKNVFLCFSNASRSNQGHVRRKWG